MEARHSGSHESWITSNAVILAHGVGMLYAWAIFVVFGSVVGRYFKPPNNRWFNWFYMHAGLQLFGWLQSVFWVGMIFTHVQADHGITGHLDGLHPWIGLIVFIASLFQPVFGWLAHRVFVATGGTSTYHTIHRWLGRVILVGAVLALTFGLERITVKVVKEDTNMLSLLYACFICICAVTIAYFEVKRFFEASRAAQLRDRVVSVELLSTEEKQRDLEDKEGGEEGRRKKKLKTVSNNVLDVGKEGSIDGDDDPADLVPVALAPVELREVAYCGGRFGFDDGVLFVFATSVILIISLMTVEMYTKRNV